MGDVTFRITYWGVTGSFARPLAPEEVTDKVVRAVEALVRAGALPPLDPTRVDLAQLRSLVERHVPEHVRSTYGGNTTCIEIETADALIVVDAGSGLRDFGIDLARRWRAPEYRGARGAHILLTHAHFDHTFGTPFFDPLYDPRNEFAIRGPQPALDSLHNMFSPTSEFNGIYHPASYLHLQGIKDMSAVSAGSEFSIGGTRITTYALTHPGGALSYRLERDGKRVVIATDHEQGRGPDEKLAEFARGADVYYADAQYLQEEYDGRAGIMGEPPMVRHGWGHTPVEGCVATAVAAEVRRLHLGHREPKRSDEDLHRVEQLAQQWMYDALAAAGRPADACEVLLLRERSRFEI